MNTTQHSQNLTEGGRRMSDDRLQPECSPANSLCPDHLDKQHGKPCPACTAEEAQRVLQFVYENLPQNNRHFSETGEGTHELFRINGQMYCQVRRWMKEFGGLVG
jgi:hypothetical protein